MDRQVTSPELIAELSEQVRELRARLEVVERRLSLAPQPVVETPAVLAEVESQALHQAAGMVPVVGRALLGIAGAYLLRAIAESGMIPQLAAVAAGVVYALWWLLSSARLAAKGHMIAGAHAVTAVLVIYPMVWETTVRFQTLPAEAAAALLAAFVAIGLAVAWQRSLREIVWVTVLAGLMTAIALLVVTHNIVPFTVSLLIMAAAIEISACRDHWLDVRGIVAMTVNLAVLLATYLISRKGGLPEGYTPVSATALFLIQTSLVVIYLASTAYRTLFLHRPISTFEVIQTALAFLLGIGGALRTAQNGDIPVALVCLAAGVACYLVAFAFLERRTAHDRNFYTYATYGLLLLLTGTLLLLGPMSASAVWSLMAITGMYTGARWQRTTLQMHGVVCLVLAALMSGALRAATAGLLYGTATLPHYAPWLAVAAAIVSYTLLHTSDDRKAAVITASLGSWCSIGLIAATATPPVAVRSVMLIGLAVALAWSSAHWLRNELMWLVYPVMAAGAYKLLAVDFAEAKPAALAVSLLCFGGALLLLPRFARRSPKADAATTAG
ncbi:MAG: hypothetical protein JST93_21710 [Acidobacteria bacterium]|nr:hypothetical protein [Acidobacteriota bacterium]